MPFEKTTCVARQLGISYWRLLGFIRSGRLAPPPKDTSGDYVWSRAQIQAVRRLIDADAREPAVAG